MLPGLTQGLARRASRGAAQGAPGVLQETQAPEGCCLQLPSGESRCARNDTVNTVSRGGGANRSRGSLPARPALCFLCQAEELPATTTRQLRGAAVHHGRQT